MTVDRSRFLGASEVAGVMGLSPWATPYSVWARKVGLAPEQDDSERMEFGRRAEPLLGEYFHDRTGLYVTGHQQVVTHPVETWAGATLDGWATETNPGRERPTLEALLGTVEYKTASAPAREWERDGIPVYYQTQAQWQMWVTGAERTWFGVLHLAYGSPQFRVYELARDETDIRLIVDRCRRFWHDHVLTGVAPEVTGHPADTEALQAIEGDGTVIEADDALATDIAMYAAVKAQEAATKRRAQELGNRLRQRMGSAVEIVRDGEWLLRWAPSPRTTIDTSALRAAHPRAVKRFEITQEVRTLRPRKPKADT